MTTFRTIETTNGAFEGLTLGKAMEAMATYYAENKHHNVPKINYVLDGEGEMLVLSPAELRSIYNDVCTLSEEISKDMECAYIDYKQYERSVSNREGQ